MGIFISQYKIYKNPLSWKAGGFFRSSFLVRLVYKTTIYSLSKGLFIIKKEPPFLTWWLTSRVMKVQTLFLFPSTWNQRKEQISRLPSLTSIFEGQPLQTNTEISHQNQWVIKYFQVPGNQLETPKTQVYFQLPPKKMLANSYGFQFI